MNERASTLEKKLTTRYLIALSLIALTILMSHIVFSRQISSSDKDAYLTNISGMQRMLSQRTALMAREIYHADTEADADIYLEKMKDVTQKLKDNNAALTSGVLANDGSYSLTPKLENIYCGDEGIYGQVTRYVDLCEQLIKLYEDNGLEAVQNSTLHKDIVSIARNGFLDRLDDVVTIYETQAEDKVETAVTLAKLTLFIGLMLLCLEGLFIFRPIVKRVITNMSELEQSNAELLEFSYRISHDLRAPIVSSLGLIKVATQSVKAEKQDLALSAMGHIETSMKRLETLIEDIITLTKMKLTDVPEETTNLSELLNETLEKVSHLENYGSIDIKIDNNVSSDFSVKTLLVKQTLQNLISNAVKYYDPNKKNPRIHIEAHMNDGKCVTSVSDNGVGIPKEYRNELFGMFKRFHPKQSFGSGLGLYLVSQNAKLLKGDIDYTPLKDGTKFTFTFPVNP